MTQTENNMTLPSKDASRKSKKPFWFQGLLIVIFLILSIIGAAALIKITWLHPTEETRIDPNFAALERRVEMLESRVTSLTEIPAASPQTEATSDVTADTVKNLQVQITQLQNQDKNHQQSARRLIAAALAFLDIREAAKNGQSFAKPLANLQTATSDDALLTEQVAKLEPYAAMPPPSLSQMRDMLMTEESSIAPQSQTMESSFWGHIISIFKPLISVHPLHNTQLSPLEQALDSNDPQKALDAFKVLPDDVQKKLSIWQTNLEARDTLDTALRALAVSFTMPTPVENAP